MNILVNIFNNSKKINPDRSIHLYIETMVTIQCLLRNMDQLFSLYINFTEIKLCAEYNFMQIHCICKPSSIMVK